MRSVYQSTDVPDWMDASACELLNEGRATFARLGLQDTTVLTDGSSVVFVPWAGDRALFTTTMALRGQGIEASVEGPSLQILGADIAELRDSLDRLLAEPAPDPKELAVFIENKEIDKWDWVLDSSLAAESAGARLLDVDGAWRLLQTFAEDVQLSAGERTGIDPVQEAAEGAPTVAASVAANQGDTPNPKPQNPKTPKPHEIIK